MSLCENREGERGRGEREEGAVGGGVSTDFFNGIFKDGFKVEVITVFMFKWRRPKTLCERACLRLYVAAGSNYSVQQAFKSTTI